MRILKQSSYVLLHFSGERLTDAEVDFILKHTETHEDIDGNIKYEGKMNYWYQNMALKPSCRI